MAESRSTTTTGSTTGNGTDDALEGARNSAASAMTEAQDRLRAGAGQMADKLPDAMASAQVAARDTQRTLEEMPDQTLLAGASFSLGLAVGLFFAGVNRLLVLAALAPAAAMAATLFGRGSDDVAGGTPTGAPRRRPTTTG